MTSNRIDYIGQKPIHSEADSSAQATPIEVAFPFISFAVIALAFLFLLLAIGFFCLYKIKCQKQRTEAGNIQTA